MPPPVPSLGVNPLRQRTSENLSSDFVPDLFRFSNTHFPATPLKSPEPPVTLSLESSRRTLPRYLMSPEPPISPLRCMTPRHLNTPRGRILHRPRSLPTRSS